MAKPEMKVLDLMKRSLLGRWGWCAARPIVAFLRLPESGEPVLNRGFQNWDCLVLNMAAWYEGRPFVREF